MNLDGFHEDGDSLNSLPIGHELADLGIEFGHKLHLQGGGSVTVVPAGEGLYSLHIEKEGVSLVFPVSGVDVRGLRGLTALVILDEHEAAKA